MKVLVKSLQQEIVTWKKSNKYKITTFSEKKIKKKREQRKKEKEKAL